MIVDAIRSLVADALSPLPVVWADQNGQRPPKPYATIVARQSDSVGQPEHREVDALGDVSVIEQRMVRCEVNVFGPSAHRIAAGLMLRLRLPSLVARADELNLGLANIGRAMNIPELMASSQYEERGMVEFAVYVAAIERDRVGIIEHVVVVEKNNEKPPGVIQSAVISSDPYTVPPPVI